MSLIGKRLQQGLFEALASSNRAVGSGGGSGLGAALLLASAYDFNTGLTISSTTDQVVLTTTFSLPRTTNVLILAVGTGSVSGSPGNYAYGSIYIDSTLYGHNNNTAVVLWDNRNGGYTSGTIPKVITLGVGNHTVTYDVHVDNVAMTWIQYQSVLEIFQLIY